MIIRQRNKGLSGRLVRTLLVSLVMGVSTHSLAMDVGRAHLASAPGQPLFVTIPLRGLSAQDLQSLSARVASEQQWVQAGLTPPVPLAGLSVRIVDGPQPNSRVIEVRASNAPSSHVIDVLIDLSSATTSRLVQSSVITRSAPQVTLAGQTYEVMRGDTLIDIARQFPVPGATLYQILWALYQANQRAFISENMNLLRAGASLSIPSAAAVLAIEPGLARAQYLAHVRAFQGSRGRPGASAVSAQANAASRAEQVTQSGGVESTPEVMAASNAVDKVRLSSLERNGNPANASGTSAASSNAIADQQTSQKLALQEEQSRRQELERNVQALKGALAATGAANAPASKSQAGQADTSLAGSSATAATGSSSTSVGDKGVAGGAGRVGAAELTSAPGGSNAASGSTGTVGNGGQTSNGTTAGAGGSTTNGSTTNGSASTATAATGAARSNTDSQTAVSQGTANQGTAGQGGGAGVAASVNNGGAQGQAAGVSSAQSSASVAGGGSAGASGMGATDRDDKTPASAAGSAVGSAAGSAVGSAADSTAGGTSGTTAGNVAGNVSGSTAGVAANSAKAASASDSAAAEAVFTDSPVAQVKQWISDNTLAAGALILAMIALFFAWIMRSSAVRESSSREVNSPQAEAFERKLKDISLDLDDVSKDAAAVPADKTSAASVSTAASTAAPARATDDSRAAGTKNGKSAGSANAKSTSGKSRGSGGGKA